MLFLKFLDEFNFDLIFKFFAGHSLGEYSALVCSGALKFEDALYLLHEEEKPCKMLYRLKSMIAVLGSDINELLK